MGGESSEIASVSDFDPNFVFPVHDLESDRHEHIGEFYEGIKGHPELFRWFPFGMYKSADDFQSGFFDLFHKDPTKLLFAVIDKSNGADQLAGAVGLLNTETANQSTEIGGVIILPAFQRTHVATNCIGLLMHYCLELPASKSCSDPEAPAEQPYGPGLGLRRTQWQANSNNTASRRLAERMGMRFEGTIRWQRVIEEGQEGLVPPEDRAKLCPAPSRHSVILSMCWDDWELEGKREHVRTMMDRVH